MKLFTAFIAFSLSSCTSKPRLHEEAVWEHWLLASCVDSLPHYIFSASQLHVALHHLPHKLIIVTLVAQLPSDKTFVQPCFHSQSKRAPHQLCLTGILRCRRSAYFEVSLPKAPLLPELITHSITQRPVCDLLTLAQKPSRIFRLPKKAPNPSTPHRYRPLTSGMQLTSR